MTETIVPLAKRLPGESKVDHDQADTVPNGTTQTIFSKTVPSDKLWILLQEKVSCRHPGDWLLTLDGDEIATGRVGAGRYNDFFMWRNGLDAAEGQNLVLKFTAYGPRPVVKLDSILEYVEQDA